jgi:hypothetical protein
MSTGATRTTHTIGTLNEKSLHAALKEWYTRPGDQLEVPVDGFVVDIVRGRLLIEIQTGNFAAIKRKLAALTSRHPVRLIYPIPQEKWIVRMSKDSNGHLGRRKSPKRGTLEHLFAELVSFPKLLSNPGFSLTVVLTHEDELRRYDGRRAWRRKGWVIQERKLLTVVGQRAFETPADMLTLLPAGLTEPFTTSDLAAAIRQPRWLAQKMAYCLREMGTITSVGKQGNAILYARAVS